jgi:hypothetical protein
MRQPAVTLVALAIRSAGSTAASPLLNTNGVLSSIPKVPVRMPKSLQPCATRL